MTSARVSHPKSLRGRDWDVMSLRARVRQKAKKSRSRP